MRRILTLIGALVVGFGGVGWYLGWYKLDVTKSADGNPQITTTVNSKKVVTDSKNGLQQAGTFVGARVEKAASDANQSVPPAGTPGPETTPPNNTSPSADGDPNSFILGPAFAVPRPGRKLTPLIAPKN